ncbi:hypothetical protein BHE90_015874 [Fusarium euwallaceae]|uniref:Apple domain-containing protein n=2 Tax=Fusarium solani species complex TaxID=232080 RepID=A0A430L209_9HYPO|nr:hypothetical protein CEP51_004264 [Fusarium floridanum]RTE69738.1 hypothetical protein BHE90_015874 [Fusarium euwallaceae]
MKYATAYLLTLALGAHALCDGMGPEEIGPGWFVECKKGILREKAYEHHPIADKEHCAQLCMDLGRPVCTYHPPTKKCLVGAEDGMDISSPDAIQIRRVEKETSYSPLDHAQQPLGLSCEDQHAACLARESKCQADLAQAHREVGVYKPDRDDCKFEEDRHPKQKLCPREDKQKYWVNDQIRFRILCFKTPNPWSHRLQSWE